MRIFQHSSYSSYPISKMSNYVEFFLLCGILQFVHSVCVQELENKTEEIKGKIKYYEQANLDLNRKLKDLDEVLRNELLKMEVHHETFETGIQAEMRKLSELKLNLSAKYAEEVCILQSIDDEQHNSTNLKLWLDLLKQDLTVLKQRRACGLSEQCKKIEISPRKFSKRKEEIEVEEHILETILKRLSSVLSCTKSLNDELNQELEDKISLHKRIREDFEEKIIHNVEDLVMARNNSLMLETKLETITSEVNMLKIKQQSLMNDNKQLRDEVKQIEDTLTTFQDDINCYQKLAQRVSKPYSPTICNINNSNSSLLCYEGKQKQYAYDVKIKIQ